ncbi:hypothetical protein D3C84_166500 [compost metagenome]
MNRRDFQGLLLVKWRQQAGQAAGQQGLAGARRTGQQQIVRAGRGHQQGTLGGDLPLHLGQIRVGQAAAQQTLGLVRGDRGLAIEVGGQLEQMLDGDDHQPGGQARFLGVGLRHH